MSEEIKVLTQEEQEAQDRAASEELITAFDFMEQHLDDDDLGFCRSPENAAKMQAFLRGKNLPFTTESLEVAYQELKAAGELTAVVPPVAQPESVETVESTASETFPWGYRLTPQTLQDMSSQEMGKWLASTKWRSEFTLQVNALRLPKSFLRMNF